MNEATLYSLSMCVWVEVPAVGVGSMDPKHCVPRVPETGEATACAACVGVYVDMPALGGFKLD